MTFISYAQNFEDVMLWRALKHIDNGFYIDVGAAWPDEHSVTKAFYDNDWDGINIEPNPEFFERYIDERPRDKSLKIALGEKAGEGEIYYISNTGLSSLDKAVSDRHSNEGWETAPAIVKIRTLAHVCEEYCLEKDIHFLKVDVEGFEEQVLRGNDWLRFRPWIVVVEAMIPLIQSDNHDGWEPILLDANYSMAYADGLNRFYVSVEHEELLTAFKYPPNIFDDFHLNVQQKAEAHATKAEAHAAKAEAHIATLLNSPSWRITAPFRWIVHQKRLLRKYGLFSRIKLLVKKIAHLFYGLAIGSISSHPRLRFICLFLARKLGLYNYLYTIYVRFSEDSHTITARPVTAEQLTPHASCIYTELKAAIDKQKKGSG